ncbi:enoyl-CoA hydratase/isomerase family protein [Oceanobacillus sp. FSL K6-2867]|uniref:enoyl-CoA hydratase/isomerase family protein n=1 Tax=Oceanobacillus sp. FSL K6-2867 TaxID=2954748 RepID=UPI0030DBB239
MNEVLFSTAKNGVATITLNRPKAINSLNHEMITSIKNMLFQWERDPAVQLIILQGAGEKGFCAGGDIKKLYQSKENETAFEGSMQFFQDEYETDQLVADFSKPILACLDGIVMGGGIGLSQGASHRIATERTKWSMPEMNIGFFPDVGAAYFLNKAPGHLGRYLALTANVLKASDVLYANGADAFIPSEHLTPLLEQINTIDWHKEQNQPAALDDVVQKFKSDPEEGKLATLQRDIDKHFAYPTIEEIINSLEADNDDFSIQTRETLLSKSVVSLKVTLRQLIEGETKSLRECLDTDLIVAANFLRSEDFYEGVRSVVIDKDHNPKYIYKQLSEVSSSMVDSFFQSSY